MADSNTALVRPNGPGEVVAAGLTAEHVQVVKDTICKGYTDTEMMLYLYECERLGLDPLARESYTFKAGGKVVIGVGIDGFRKRANDTGCYMPGKPTEYEMEGKNLIRARVHVKKLVGGDWHEFCEDAYMEEFKGSSPNWRTMQRVMLSKCAEARALRRAFPRELGGLYIPEERDAIERNTRTPRSSDPFAPPPIDITAEPVDPTQPPPADPPRVSPKQQVWNAAQSLGLTGDDVKAVIAETGAPTDARTWKKEDVAIITSALAERARAAREAPPERTVQPWDPGYDGGHHFEEARSLAEQMGSSDEEWTAALHAALPDGLPHAWTENETDAVLNALERAKGA